MSNPEQSHRSNLSPEIRSEKLKTPKTPEQEKQKAFKDLEANLNQAKAVVEDYDSVERRKQTSASQVLSEYGSAEIATSLNTWIKENDKLLDGNADLKKIEEANREIGNLLYQAEQGLLKPKTKDEKIAMRKEYQESIPRNLKDNYLIEADGYIHFKDPELGVDVKIMQEDGTSKFAANGRNLLIKQSDGAIITFDEKETRPPKIDIKFDGNTLAQIDFEASSGVRRILSDESKNQYFIKNTVDQRDYKEVSRQEYEDFISEKDIVAKLKKPEISLREISSKDELIKAYTDLISYVETENLGNFHTVRNLKKRLSEIEERGFIKEDIDYETANSEQLKSDDVGYLVYNLRNVDPSLYNLEKSISDQIDEGNAMRKVETNKQASAPKSKLGSLKGVRLTSSSIIYKNKSIDLGELKNTIGEENLYKRLKGSKNMEKDFSRISSEVYVENTLNYLGVDPSIFDFANMDIRELRQYQRLSESGRADTLIKLADEKLEKLTDNHEAEYRKAKAKIDSLYIKGTKAEYGVLEKVKAAVLERVNDAEISDYIVKNIEAQVNKMLLSQEDRFNSLFLAHESASSLDEKREIFNQITNLEAELRDSINLLVKDSESFKRLNSKENEDDLSTEKAEIKEEIAEKKEKSKKLKFAALRDEANELLNVSFDTDTEIAHRDIRQMKAYIVDGVMGETNQVDFGIGNRIANLLSSEECPFSNKLRQSMKEAKYIIENGKIDDVGILENILDEIKFENLKKEMDDLIKDINEEKYEEKFGLGESSIKKRKDMMDRINKIPELRLGDRTGINDAKIRPNFSFKLAGKREKFYLSGDDMDKVLDLTKASDSEIKKTLAKIALDQKKEPIYDSKFNQALVKISGRKIKLKEKGLTIY